jgi:hypothetical protein
VGSPPDPLYDVSGEYSNSRRTDPFSRRLGAAKKALSPMSRGDRDV